MEWDVLEAAPRGRQASRQGWRRWRAAVVAWLALAWLLALPAAHAERRALVIGNAAYAESPLKNPVNDAHAMERKLTQLGFRVQRIVNFRRDQIGRLLTSFAASLKPGDEVVFFYAGHGLQVKGHNYLPAVDARIETEEDVPLNSLNLTALMERLEEAKVGLKILLLDACRNNPFARNFRSQDRGLARVADAAAGTLVHFATRPGSVAADGTGENGLYTSHLLKYLDQPDTPVESMLKKVSAEVEAASGGQQSPWVEGSIRGEFFFRGGPVAHAAPTAAAPPPSGKLPTQEQTEQLAWEAAQRSNTEAAYKAFIAEFPRSRYVRLARVALAALAAPQQAAVQPGRPARSLQPGEGLQDCPDCPRMVMVPAGEFVMGSTAEEAGRSSDEGPQRRVSVGAFLIGATEVTQAQWHALMGRSHASWFASCGPDCPVEQVTWDEAQEFTRRLSQRTGRRYHLPSEAQWEYACRAGGRHRFCGDDVADLVAWTNVSTTQRVGQNRANAWGLYDMSGNVWEWVQDCWHADYTGAPSDARAWESGDCGDRVARGGGWSNPEHELRAAARAGLQGTLRYHDTGLRVARSVD